MNDYSRKRRRQRVSVMTTHTALFTL